MSKILILGARGRAGAAAVAEARSRGHDVLAAARRRTTVLDSVNVAGPEVVGDVTDAGRVVELAAGCDAVIVGVYDGDRDPAVFFPAAARAVVEGLGKAGVSRLVWVGLASILPTADGTLLMDTADYPNEYRPFFLAHQAALDVIAGSSLDWVSIAPAGDFNHADPTRTGGYRVAPANAQDLISYADLAIALVDEIDRPAHHREAIGVTVRTGARSDSPYGR